MVIHKDMLLTVGHNRPGIKLEPKGVVIHYTANPQKGANAIANRNYFENHPKIYASAHYVVDDTYVIKCIPENEVAWHCGENKTKLAIEKFDGNQNKYLIGIEMCVNSDGDWEKTYQNTIELVVDILNRYGWTIDDILRHYDLTNKACPKMMTKYVEGGEKYFQKFKNDVQNKLNGVIDTIEKWQVDLGRKAIDKLVLKNLLSNPEQWKQEDKLEGFIPGWLFFEMISRIIKESD
jgi:N-acetylmuramoyl-L-alanine amidase